MTELYKKYMDPVQDREERIREMIDSFGIPYDEDHTDFIEQVKNEGIEPPFIEWYMDDVPFYADGTVYFVVTSLVIRVYTDTADKSTNREIKHILRHNEMNFETVVKIIPEMSIRETTYTMEVS